MQLYESGKGERRGVDGQYFAVPTVDDALDVLGDELDGF